MITTIIKHILRSKKNFAASLLIVLTLLLTLITLFLSDFFQNPEKSLTQKVDNFALISEEEIEQISKIQVDNRLGSFLLEKKLGSWYLTSPKRLMAQNEMVSNLLKVLLEIKVKKMIHLDPINMANYSLDAPELKIKFWDEEKNERLLKIGVINPIDNSSFMTLSGEDSIFQTESKREFIEKLDLSHLLTSQIFSISSELANHLVLKKNGTTLINWKRSKEDEWVDQKGEKISSTKVADYFKRLNSIRSELVVDQLSNSAQLELNDLLKKPLYELEIEFKNEAVQSFEFSGINVGSGELRLQNKNSFIIRSSEASHPYIVPESEAAQITNY